jgi:hypothetical protein
VGLVPARDQSEDRDPREKRISKEGEEMLKRLLVGSAHFILGPFGSDSDLKRQDVYSQSPVLLIAISQIGHSNDQSRS